MSWNFLFFLLKNNVKKKEILIQVSPVSFWTMLLVTKSKALLAVVKFFLFFSLIRLTKLLDETYSVSYSEMK